MSYSDGVTHGQVIMGYEVKSVHKLTCSQYATWRSCAIMRLGSMLVVVSGAWNRASRCFTTVGSGLSAASMSDSTPCSRLGLESCPATRKRVPSAGHSEQGLPALMRLVGEARMPFFVQDTPMITWQDTPSSGRGRAHGADTHQSAIETFGESSLSCCRHPWPPTCIYHMTV